MVGERMQTVYRSGDGHASAQSAFPNACEKSGASPVAAGSNIPNQAHVTDRRVAFAFEDLDHAPLIVDAVYSGGNQGNRGDDPIQRLTGTGNAGGFRLRSNLART